MVKDIDDLADDRSFDLDPAGERFRETFLDSRPASQWPAFIDEIARDIVAGISIGETGLWKNNFDREVGPYYKQGVIKASGEDTDLPDVLREDVTSRDLGNIVYQLNELSYQIQRKGVNLDNIQQAIEAVIEKILTRKTEQTVRPHLGESGGSIADVTMRLFSNRDVAQQADLIIEEFENSVGQGLLAKLDEPQMMTPLWDHQADALETWCEAGFRGYADMATATGKTVLGLAAIALRYGQLHPEDSDIALEASADQVSDASGDDRILIVAHNDLILEQWRREFDRHLNIPSERTHGSDEISLTWGTIHFRTAQRLLNQELVSYDLVILDEAHHYASGSEWGELLEEFDAEVLALSGSVDDAGVDSQRLQDRLQNAIGPEIKRYTVAQGLADNVIPAFDWSVRYAPIAGDTEEFATITERCEDLYEEITEELRSGDLTIESERSLRTYEDIRRFSHTTAGSKLKRKNETFRDLATALFSRRTRRWNRSPALDAIADIVTDHADSEKVVVLTQSNTQIDALEDLLSKRLEDTRIWSIYGRDDSDTQRDVIDEFDTPGTPGVLIGTGDLLGEGVDMPHATVAVNMATGTVNPELVQRIGRVLRNPDEEKHANFYNVVAIPVDEEARVDREDGLRLIENAAKFCALGGRFENLPGFATVSRQTEAAVEDLVGAGAERLRQLDAEEHYEWPDDPGEVAHLNSLLDIAEEELAAGHGSSEILAEWSEYAWGQSTPAIAHRKQPETPPQQRLCIRVIDPDEARSQPNNIHVMWDSDSIQGKIEDNLAVVDIPANVDEIEVTTDCSAHDAIHFELTDEATVVPLTVAPVADQCPSTTPPSTDSGKETEARQQHEIQIRDRDGNPVTGSLLTATADRYVETVRCSNDGRAILAPPGDCNEIAIALSGEDGTVSAESVRLSEERTTEVTLRLES